LKQQSTRWTVYIGGPVRGETTSHQSKKAAVAAVHSHYDTQLKRVLYSPDGASTRTAWRNEGRPTRNARHSEMSSISRGAGGNGCILRLTRTNGRERLAQDASRPSRSTVYHSPCSRRAQQRRFGREDGKRPPFARFLAGRADLRRADVQWTRASFIIRWSPSMSALRSSSSSMSNPTSPQRTPPTGTRPPNNIASRNSNF
jgi:hypothetical protein